jgi:serine/threonine-protein kinase
VYAAGIVLFELLTGRPPYSGESAMNVAYQHVHSRVPAPSSQIRGIPNEIDELVIAATDPDPSVRPSDAGAFLAEIAEIRADLNLPITPIPQRAREARHVAPARPTEDTSRTQLLDGSGRTDTQVVPRHAAGPDGPLPPIVAPAPARGGGKPKRGRAMSPRQRRRRRTIIGLVLVALLGIGSAVGGILLVNWYEDWNHHVPTLKGDDVAKAETALRNNGYQVGTTQHAYSTSVPAGEIISTSPSAGTRLDRGKPVNLIISQGIHTAIVPSVKGLSLGTAEAKLHQFGFTFGPGPSTEYSASVPKGDVTQTDPPAGSKKAYGFTLTIYVSNGPPPSNVPPLSPNESFSDYQNALNQANLKADRQPDQFSDTVPAGDVISINPSTGQLPQGQSVQVTVSKGPQMVQVPKIHRGDSGESAKAALQAVGLVCQFDTSLDGGVFDKVYSVTPHSGQMVPAGSTVVVVLL